MSKRRERQDSDDDSDDRYPKRARDARDARDVGDRPSQYIQCLHEILKVVEDEWGYTVLKIECPLDLKPCESHCKTCRCSSNELLARVHTIKVSENNGGTVVAIEISDVYSNRDGGFHVGGGGGGSFPAGYFIPGGFRKEYCMGGMVSNLTDIWDLIWGHPEIMILDKTEHDKNFYCSQARARAIPPRPVEIRDRDHQFVDLKCSMCQAPSHFVFEKPLKL